MGSRKEKKSSATNGNITEDIVDEKMVGHWNSSREEDFVPDYEKDLEERGGEKGQLEKGTRGSEGGNVDMEREEDQQPKKK